MAPSPSPATAAGAQPTTGGDQEPPSTETTTSSSANDVALVQDLSADGEITSSVTYDAAGNGVVELPDGTLIRAAGDGSGAGTKPSTSGCRRVTVHNRGESISGDLVYMYNTWTEWCWDRASRKITSVRTKDYLSHVASSMYYRGVVGSDERFYNWRSGYNKSGHWHERQSHWENCIAKYGCVSNDYPRNIIRAHSDGTYTWAAFD
jgi:hypothetical protein